MKTWPQPNYGSYNCVTCHKQFETDKDNLRHLIQVHNNDSIE